MDFSTLVTILVIVVGGSAVFYFMNKRKSTGSAGSSVAFTTDISAAAEAQSIDKVIGRDEEIERIVHILLRRKKNNPLLLGEPGVGKTSIVEGLALKIADGTVPSQLREKRLLALDLNALMAGTQYRGELEKRLDSVLKTVSGKGSVVLFIDEIHLLQQVGKSEGSMSISDVIKPILANGTLQIIGATTWKEYKEYIEPDEAFDRRMQPVLVDEPTQEEAIEMLQGLKKLYEDHHKVSISQEAIEAAVKMSDELIDHRYLPDKAIDLIDEAAAKASIEAERSKAVSMGVLHAASKEADSEVGVEEIKEVIDQWIVHNKEDAQRDARK